MRISVDLNRCQGYGQCCFADPSVFKLRGEEVLEFDPAPGDEHRLKVIRAAKACPVQAISIGESYEEQEERANRHE